MAVQYVFACCTSELNDVFEPPGTPHERAIKHKIDLLLEPVPPADR